MKLIGIISTAFLSLTLGATAPAFAQQEQHDQQEEQKAKPAEKKAQSEKPVKQHERNAQQQDKNHQQEQKGAQQQNRNNQQEQKNAQQQERNNQQEQKNAQQQSGKQEQHAGGNRGGRIPDDRFRANFGREHRFRISQADYSRDRRFQYGGYSFGFVDPWPTNWLYTEDVFVVEIDGVYYLCNASYPGVNITLSITL